MLSLLVAVTACSPPIPIATPATPQAIRTNVEMSKSPLTLVHVWATWCDPCREEFPELMKVYEEYRNKGLELILVSADDPADAEAVQAFLLKQSSTVDSLITTELNQAFIETLSPKWAGSLPSSFFYIEGRLVAEWEGKRTYAQYAEQIETLLK